MIDYLRHIDLTSYWIGYLVGITAGASLGYAYVTRQWRKDIERRYRG